MIFFNKKLKANEAFEMVDFDDCYGTNYIPVDDSGRILLFLKAEDPVTIHGGDGVFGGKDLVIQTTGNYQMVMLESGTYAITEGEHKGHIAVSGENYYAHAIYLV